MVVLGGHRGGDELGLPAGPVRRDDQAAGDRVGDRRAVVEAARDISSPDTPAPTAVDERGRSAQTFLVDVVLRSGGEERRAMASGQDIYAVTAPLAVEAVDRVLTGRTRTAGVASAGAIFDAPDFLRALSPHISTEL
ncbi:hypothetical protein [Actinomadura sp. B10D3]|uniref:hypothetical protein n=1 Tax=Actinomadura sp. B10D3 TaxID=3153557 RepID=UPI00325D384D